MQNNFDFFVFKGYGWTIDLPTLHLNPSDKESEREQGRGRGRGRAREGEGEGGRGMEERDGESARERD